MSAELAPVDVEAAPEIVEAIRALPVERQRACLAEWEAIALREIEAEATATAERLATLQAALPSSPLSEGDSPGDDAAPPASPPQEAEPAPSPSDSTGNGADPAPRGRAKRNQVAALERDDEIVAYLEKNGPVPGPELARDLTIPPGSLAGTMDRLERAGRVAQTGERRMPGAGRASKLWDVPKPRGGTQVLTGADGSVASIEGAVLSKLQIGAANVPELEERLTVDGYDVSRADLEAAIDKLKREGEVQNYPGSSTVFKLAAL